MLFFWAVVVTPVAAGVKRRPLAIAVSGGGFTSMTGGMAVARALRNLNSRDALADVTHIGGNSGGSFFGNQFLHSKAFFNNVTNASLPLDVVVTDWLGTHVDTLQGLMQKNGPLQKEFGSIGLLKPESGCEAVNIVQVGLVFPALSKAAKFPLRWLPLVAAAVLKHSLGNKSASSATYADVNHTLPGVSLISQLTLPPDAWTSHNKDAGHTSISTLHATMKDGSTFNFSEKGHALPVAFISEGPKKHGWTYDSEIVELLTAPTCPYKGLFSKRKCHKPPYQPVDMMLLPLPEHPLLAEITAGSGGWGGFAASPSAYGSVAHKFEDYVTKGAGIISKPLLDEVIKCWPYGAQMLSPPMVRQGTSVTQSEDDVPYRYMDGGYAENTALPMTLAKAQQDCEDGVLDCSKPIQLILINDGNISTNHTGPSCCRAKDPLKSLFSDASRPVGTFVSGMFQTVKVPVQTIFAEPFPVLSEWKQYNEFPSKRKSDPLNPFSHEWVQQNIKSMMWSGTLSTVENKHFGVKGGQKVQLLVFSLEIPGIVWPGLFDAEQTQLISPGHLRIADGAVMKDADLIAGHAPMAKAQAEAMVPVLETFLNPSSFVYV